MRIGRRRLISAAVLIGAAISGFTTLHSGEPPSTEPPKNAATSSTAITAGTRSNAAIYWYRAFLSLPRDADGHQEWATLRKATPPAATAFPWLDDSFAGDIGFLESGIRASTMAEVDWGDDPTSRSLVSLEESYAADWTHLAMAHAVWAAMHDRPEAALDDLTAVLALAHHLVRGGGKIACAQSCLLMANDVDRVTAAVMTRLPNAQRAGLAERMEAQSGEDIVGEAIGHEIDGAAALIRRYRAIPVAQRAAEASRLNAFKVEVFPFDDRQLDEMLAEISDLGAHLLGRPAADAPGRLRVLDEFAGRVAVKESEIRLIAPRIREAIDAGQSYRVLHALLLDALRHPEPPATTIDGRAVAVVRYPDGSEIWRCSGDRPPEAEPSREATPMQVGGQLWFPAATTFPWIPMPGASVRKESGDQPTPSGK